MTRVGVGEAHIAEFDFAFLARLARVLRAVGGVDALIDWSVKSPEIDLMRYMDDKRAKEDKVFDQPKLMKTPVVRNGKQATVGYCPEIWETWE